LIDYSRGGISICNRDRVEEVACTCYAELAWSSHWSAGFLHECKSFICISLWFLTAL